MGLVRFDLSGGYLVALFHCFLLEWDVLDLFTKK